MVSTISINRQRILYIDQIKGFTILLVIIGHVLENLIHSNPPGGILREIIYSFHMPLFFILSGMLFIKPNNFIDAFKKRLIKLIIPFFIWGIFFSLFQHGNLSDFFIRGKVEHMWFIIILLECYFFHYGLLVFCKKLHIYQNYEIIVFPIFIIILEIIRRYINPSFSLISFTQFTIMYRFYVIGYLFKFIKTKYKFNFPLLLPTIIFMITFTFNHYNTANILTFMLCALCGSLVVYYSFKNNVLHLPSKLLLKLEYLGYNSIFFYLGHMFFLKYKLLETDTIPQSITSIIAIIIAIIILIIMNYMLKAIEKSKICSFLLLGRGLR